MRMNPIRMRMRIILNKYYEKKTNLLMKKNFIRMRMNSIRMRMRIFLYPNIFKNNQTTKKKKHIKILRNLDNYTRNKTGQISKIL